MESSMWSLQQTVASMWMLVYFCKVCQAEADPRQQRGTCASFCLYPHIFGGVHQYLIMIHLLDKWFVPWAQLHTLNVSTTYIKSLVRQWTANLGWQSSVLRNWYYKEWSFAYWSGTVESKGTGRAVQHRLSEPLIMSVFQRAQVMVDTRAVSTLLTSSLLGSSPPLPGSNIKNTETFPSNFYMKNLIIYTRN